MEDGRELDASKNDKMIEKNKNFSKLWREALNNSIRFLESITRKLTQNKKMFLQIDKFRML